MKKVLLAVADFGIGGISKSAIEFFDTVDYDKYDITLYIRRKDVLELLDRVNEHVNIVTADNPLKRYEFDNSVGDKCLKLVCGIMKKFKMNYLRKRLYRAVKEPKQRKAEEVFFKQNSLSYDVAIAYSTSDDIPTFILDNIESKLKYLFIHQSTPFSRQNQKRLNDFDGIVAVNDMLCQKLRGEFPKISKFFALTNYVDKDHILKQADMIDFNPSKPFSIVSCGRLEPVKGYELAVKTASELKKNNIEFVWYWVGDGSGRGAIEKSVREAGLEDEFIILGNQLNPYPYIGKCDIYVQSSVAEACPLAILEAMALEKVVVTTKTVGGKNLCRMNNCGVLTEYDAEELSQAIMGLLSDKALFEEQKNKVKSINWDVQKEAYCKKWESLLEGDLDTSSLPDSH